jgi:hypothetical protein
MNAAGAINSLFANFPIKRCIDLIESLSRLDRFQASRGIEEAAQQVADAAQRAGLKDVEILRLPADGAAHWGTFRAPQSWTPLTGTLDILAQGAAHRLISFPDQPCTLATYSAPTPPEGARLRIVDGTSLDTSAPVPWPGVRDALVLLPAAIAPRHPPTPLLVDGLTRSGAGGFATDVASARLPADSGAAGRIELPRDARIFGFSVSPAVMDSLMTAARHNDPVRVRVDVTRDALMPLVHGSLPGAAPEVLLHAHLCHPRPAANDNGSGVAALVGIAEALSGMDGGADRRGVRFLWAPEFAGTAAFLYDLVIRGPLSPPVCTLNLDMVGEDQVRCGGPLVIERPPAHVPSYLPALAEDFLALLPSSIKSYSGAVELPEWRSASIPFVGASDHALFADREIMCPSICIGHWPDRFRHSALDTPDKVSADELRRAGSTAAAIAAFVRSARVDDLPYLYSVIARHTTGQMLAIARSAAHGRPSHGATFDPFAPANVPSFLRNQVRQADGAMAAAIRLTGTSKSPPPALSSWLTAYADGLAQWAAGAMAGPNAAGVSSNLEETTYRRVWPGPFNFEGLLDAADPEDRRWLITMDYNDESAYSQAMALALAIGRHSTFDQIVTEAAYSTWMPIDIDFAQRYLQILTKTGWVAT